MTQINFPCFYKFINKTIYIHLWITFDTCNDVIFDFCLIISIILDFNDSDLSVT